MICGFCKKVIPDDSIFCPVCGKDVKKQTFNENNLEEKRDILSEKEINEFSEEIPILIEKIKLTKNASTEEVFLNCIFRNLSSKSIQAISVDIDCYDVWGENVGRQKGIQYLDLNIKKNDRFGGEKDILLSFLTTRVVKIFVTKVLYADGGIIESENNTSAIKLLPLCEYFNSDDAVGYYQSLTSDQSRYCPVEKKRFWLCSCGAVNDNLEVRCGICHQERSRIFSLLDREYLYNNYNQFVKDEMQAKDKEKAEFERQQIIEAERKRNELKESIRKRRQADLAATKRSRKIKLGIVAAIVVFITIGGINAYQKSVFNGQLRNMATEEMDSAYTNVYIDAVSIEPLYCVYEYKTAGQYSKARIGPERLNKIVCKCKTFEGKTVWVSFFYQYYPGYNMGWDEEDYKSLKYSKSNPLRITGDVDTARQVVKELEDDLGDIFVLDARKQE